MPLFSELVPQHNNIGLTLVTVDLFRQHLMSNWSFNNRQQGIDLDIMKSFPVIFSLVINALNYKACLELDCSLLNQKTMHYVSLRAYSLTYFFTFPCFQNTYLKSTDKAWLNPVTGKPCAKALHNTCQALYCRKTRDRQHHMSYLQLQHGLVCSYLIYFWN